MIHVILVDDDPVVTASLKTILKADGEITVVGTGKDGSEALSLYREKKPDVCLLDIQMKQKSGIEAAKEILKFDETAKILFLTTFSNDEYIISAIGMGAKGYILKQDFDKIAAAVKAVYFGQSVLGDEVISKLPQLMESKPAANFTQYGIEPREKEIIAMVADGLSNGDRRDYFSERGHSAQLYQCDTR